MKRVADAGSTYAGDHVPGVEEQDGGNQVHYPC